MDLIYIIVFIIGFIYFNNRIGAIEKKLRGEEVKVPQQALPTFDQVVTAQVSGNPVVAESTSQPVPTSTISTSEFNEEIGGQWLGKIGILALLVGISIFLKYAFDNNLIGVTGRVILGILAGGVLIGLGQFLRSKYRLYSDVLMGGGIGVLYLTTYAAFIFYQLISSPVAYALLVVITAVAVSISILDGTVTLAAVGVFGGFLTPLLMTFGSHDYLALLSYITILDIGILAVAFAYRWLQLTYLGFFGTLVIYVSWYTTGYTEDMLGVAMFFATIYFLIFLFSTILHHIVRKEVSNESDVGIITLNGVLYAAISYSLLNPTMHAYMGFFMLALAVLYFVVGIIAFFTNKEDKYLNLYLPGLSVLFLTLAIPLQFSGEWITLAWFVESILLFVVDYSVRGKNLYSFGTIVFAIGLIRFFAIDNWYGGGVDFVAFANTRFFLLVASIVTAYCITLISQMEFKLSKSVEMKKFVVGFVLLAQLLTIFAITTEISAMYAHDEAVIVDTNNRTVNQENSYNGGTSYPYDYSRSSEIASMENQKNTVISVFWALYATLLIAIGFMRKNRPIRIFGLVFFFITALKVFADVWSLGQIYQIASSIAFGVIALVGSFVYAKFKHRINEII